MPHWSNNSEKYDLIIIMCHIYQTCVTFIKQFWQIWFNHYHASVTQSKCIWLCLIKTKLNQESTDSTCIIFRSQSETRAPLELGSGRWTLVHVGLEWSRKRLREGLKATGNLRPSASASTSPLNVSYPENRTNTALSLRRHCDSCVYDDFDGAGSDGNAYCILMSHTHWVLW